MKTTHLRLEKPFPGAMSPVPYVEAMMDAIDRIQAGLMEFDIESDADIDMTSLIVETQNQCLVINDPNGFLTASRKVLMPAECRGMRVMINNAAQSIAVQQGTSPAVEVAPNQICELIMTGTKIIAPVSPAAFANKESLGGGMAVVKHENQEAYDALTPVQKADPNVLHIVA